ncbi:MAG: hypothetical protein EHM13_13115 [Acidobacteria bacterium]|nr:MAG: hypothetical protein EHM13_13115 [Acidobacteriota bacterium]
MNRLPGTFAQPDPSDVTWTHVIYALHGFGVALGVATSALIVTSFLFSLPSIIAVVMNYVRRSRVRGTYLASHFRWQIRTFWYALLWMAVATLISVPLMLVIVGFLTLWLAIAVVGVWVLYRVVRGWLRLSSELPMYT